MTIAGKQVYEPLIHEWFHGLDWALYNLNRSKDIYEGKGPDWANWKTGNWPACDTGPLNTYAYFPSVDLCEWDPDWRDCNNVASAGACLHAGEAGGQDSWYEHVIAAHYPRQIRYVGKPVPGWAHGFRRDGGGSWWALPMKSDGDHINREILVYQEDIWHQQNPSIPGISLLQLRHKHVTIYP